MIAPSRIARTVAAAASGTIGEGAERLGFGRHLGQRESIQYDRHRVSSMASCGQAEEASEKPSDDLQEPAGVASEDDADLAVRIKTVHAEHDPLRPDLQLPPFIDKRVQGMTDIGIGDIIL